MGRDEKRATPHRAGQAHSGDPAPQVFFVDVIPLRGLGAHGYSAWLEEYKQLEKDGWEITVLVANDGSHSVALGYQPVDLPAAPGSPPVG